MCYNCAKPLNFLLPISRTEVCPNCGRDVRCCKNCIHYSVGSHYDCKEHVDELISEKERANFCDWFSLNAKATIGEAVHTKTDDTKNAFNSLFGD